MSKVKSSNTLPELLVRRLLHGDGYRYGLHNKRLLGKPDIILRTKRTIIMVHGCFWHGHQGCPKARLPKTNATWWEQKQKYNREKDRRDKKALRALGWRVITVWQCHLTSKKIQKTLRRLKKRLTETKVFE